MTVKQRGLAEHSNYGDLATLRVDVVRLRNLNMGVPAALSAYETVLDLIDQRAEKKREAGQ